MKPVLACVLAGLLLWSPDVAAQVDGFRPVSDDMLRDPDPGTG